MKKYVVFISIFLLSGLIASAQLNNTATASSEASLKQLPAKIFTQFVQSALNPKVLTTGFTKEKKLLLKDIDKADAALLAKKISSLTDVIKPTGFKNTFNISSIKNNAAAVKTIPEAIALLKDIEAGLKPEAIAGIWLLQRNAWLSDVNRLK
jgi:hypothetical protein